MPGLRAQDTVKGVEKTLQTQIRMINWDNHLSSVVRITNLRRLSLDTVHRCVWTMQSAESWCSVVKSLQTQMRQWASIDDTKGRHMLLVRCQSTMKKINLLTSTAPSKIVRSKKMSKKALDNSEVNQTTNCTEVKTLTVKASKLVQAARIGICSHQRPVSSWQRVRIWVTLGCNLILARNCNIHNF